MKVFKNSFNFFACTVLIGLTLGFITTTAMALPISVDIDSSQYYIAEFYFALPGDELRIDYLVYNTSSFSDPSNAFKTIEILAGRNNSVYDFWVPEGWIADISEDKTVFSTSDSSNYIYPGQPLPVVFYLLFDNTALTTGQGQAMTPLGLWADPVSVNIAEVPEPSTIALLGFGLLLAKRKRKNKIRQIAISADYHKSL